MDRNHCACGREVRRRRRRAIAGKCVGREGDLDELGPAGTPRRRRHGGGGGLDLDQHHRRRPGTLDEDIGGLGQPRDPHRVRDHHHLDLGGVGGVVAGEAPQARAERAARRRRIGKAHAMGKAGALQQDDERLRGLAGAEGHLVVDLVGVDFPVVAGRRLERHRHRRRLARRALAGERVVDEVEPPRRLRALRCDGDSRGRRRHRDRFGRVARPRLGIAPIVDEARPHPDRLALVGPDQRVGLPGRAGDVPVPVPVDADPLVGVDRLSHAVEVADIPGRCGQRLADPHRARNRRTALRTASAHPGIVADRYGEARRVVAGFVLNRKGVVTGVRVGVGDRNHLAPADGREMRKARTSPKCSAKLR